GASGDESNYIRKQHNGSIYISGTFQGTADFDPNAGTANLTSGGTYDVFVAKYSCSAPNAPAFISGPQKVCKGQTGVQYIAAQASGASQYTWALPPGVSIDSASNDTIWVSFGNQASGGSILARASNGCSIGPYSPGLMVTIDSLPTASLSSPSDRLCLN